MLRECAAAVGRPHEFGDVRDIGLAPGLEFEDEAAVPLAVVAGEEYVDPRASGCGDVVFDGDLHVVIDAGPPERAGKAGVLVGPDGAIRGHASGLPLEPVDEPAFQPVEVDIFEEIPLGLGVDDHGREHTLPPKETRSSAMPAVPTPTPATPRREAACECGRIQGR